MEFLNPQSPKFLGGSNIQNAFILLGVGILVYKAMKK